MLLAGHDVDLYAIRWDGERKPADAGDHGRLRLFPLEILTSRNCREREQRLIQLNRVLQLQLERAGPYDLVYERFSLWSSAAQAFAAHRGIPSLLEVNAPLVEEQRRYRQLIDDVSAARLAQEAFADAAGIIAVSSAVAEYVRGTHVATPIRVIPNGVALENFAASRASIRRRLHRRAAGESREPICIGFLGTLRAWHGMAELGTAFADFCSRQPDSRLLVVGDGPARTELLQAAGPYSNALEITGKLCHSQVAAQVAQFDIAVAPYSDQIDFYFSPLKLFEYMACGLPIVASDAGDLSKYITHGETGWLVPPGSGRAISTALGELTRCWQNAAHMGAQAARLAAARHTWQHVLQSSFDLVGVGDSADLRSVKRRGA
jgi:glycosyltransferase involved in cell wall biosynthesis